jgi:ELWxxDGT repeat protein
VLVNDINPGSGYSFPSFLTVLTNTLLFQADDGVRGFELWRSDGTGPGTVLVKDIDVRAGNNAGAIYTAVVNGEFFFEADNVVDGFELWKSDGTDAGTVMVKDINPAPEGDSGASFLTPVNSATLYFTAFDGPVSAGGGGHGVELWISDGTEAGTRLVKDIWPGTTTSNPYGLTAMNGSLFFSADDGVHGVELWKSDGTDTGGSCDPGTNAGTCLVLDIKP